MESSFLITLNSLIEGIAIIDISRFQTSLKPFHALLATTMGKAVWYNLSCRTFL